MISAKDLSEEQLATLRAWAADGAQLAEIQKRLVDDFKLNATYMDTRFLILDLGIELLPEHSEEEAEEAAAAEEPPTESTLVEDPSQPAPAAGGITVTTDELARPGMIVSGLVTFSDGEKAQWFIDQMGRPGLDPDTPGYQPKEEDLVEFEKELRKVLER